MGLDTHLESLLLDVARRRARLRLLLRVASCWAGAGFVGLLLVLFQRQAGWSSWWVIPIIAIAAIGACFLVAGSFRHRLDLRQTARQIESRHPELNGLLITAAQQDSNDGKPLSYLQTRIVRDAIFHGAVSHWAEAVPRSRLLIAQAANVLAVGFLALILWELRPAETAKVASRHRTGNKMSVEITPGDSSIEKGNSMVVLARFGGPLPASVELVIGEGAGQSRLPLVKSLADPVFGMSISEVTSNLSYHVEYGNRRTRDFRVTVFEHPRLERADAALVFPEYTGLEAKTVRDTRRISAVEGSQLSYTLRLNKPVASAKLVPRTKGAIGLLLKVETNRPLASLQGLPLLTSGTYDLQLLDLEGRTNKVEAQFVFQVLRNRTPELRLTSPRGDIRPSPLEEIQFEGTVSDDFGVQTYGLGYALAGEEPKYLYLGTNTAANEKHSFRHLLRLEELKVAPDQLICWFAWADDIGPDGQARRTVGDLFFGEVRPFEAVYREGQGNEGAGQGQGEQGGEGGGQLSKLAELQKQIISATWKLQGRIAGTRVPGPGAGAKRPPASSGDQSSSHPPPRAPLLSAPRPVLVMAQTAPSRRNSGNSTRPDSPIGDIPGDADVIRESQAQALEQAQAAFESQQDPRTAGLWKSALEHMQTALDRLREANPASESYKEALAAEQNAYQALLRLQEHEYQVSRSRRSQGQTGNSREQQMQRQLDQMELTQSENRYETRRQAQAPQSGQRREESQLMNRLQQLAQRQQDLNERLKELQTALQEAKTEQEREEIRRRLKRLEEEEQRMLADLDEMRQRMDQPENQSSMADQRRQLDQTREDVQQAAEAAAKGEPSQALASGSRAQEQLQQIREQLRQGSSGRFGEDLRQMRSEARELTRKQEELNRQIETEPVREGKSLQDTSGPTQMLADLDQQKQRFTNLVERTAQVSQDAEGTEPLLSKQLYDTMRKLSQNTAKDIKELQSQLLNRGLLSSRLLEQLSNPGEQDGAKLLQLTSEMVRRGVMPQARETGTRALSAMNDMQRGIEAAAESLLGDDTEALRQAQAQLDDLAEQLRREAAAAGSGRSPTNAPWAESEARPGGMGTNTASATPDAQAPPQEQARGSEAKAQREGQESRQAGEPGRPDGPGGGRGNQTAEANPDSSRTGLNAGERRTGQRRTGERLGLSASEGSEGGNIHDMLDHLFEDAGVTQAGPITGNDFVRWSDRLRDVEDMLEFPDLRNEVSAVRERARQMRQDYKRDLKKPDWAVVRLQVINPLVEVRDRIGEELARRGSREALVPVDRDPVPGRYSDLVRTYYERLGKDK